MSYLPHTDDEVRTMLDRIGLERSEDLFAAVPENLRRRAGLKLAPELDEPALLKYFAAQAARNVSVRTNASFLGAGVYHHFIPSSVGALASRGEFMTAYTPYQAEISQGTLQAIYEFQTMLCQLLALDVANASLYDGASATAEAALMAMRVTRRQVIYIAQGVHPHYRKVVETYTRGLGAELELLPLGEDGRTQLPNSLPDESAAVILQSPNFYGCIEDLAAAAEKAHTAGALAISTTTEALALALLEAPGTLGVDIACGEAQSFGVPISFGGPHVGFMAARARLVRNLPGRLIGETVDSDGQRAFVMTLTTREQHIRRERATSNICTNQALMALRVTIFLALMGRRGLRRLAEMNHALACYAKRELTLAGLRLPYAAAAFNEFVVEVPQLAERLRRCQEQGIQPGVALDELGDATDRLLVCTTEMNDREEIDRLVRELAA